MLFKIAPEIFRDFPGFKLGLVVVHNVDNKKINSNIVQLLEKTQQEISKKINKDFLEKHSQLIAWRNAYKKFGTNPKDYLSSIENMLTRISKGQSIKSINTLVDLYNIVSLKYVLPSGGQDLDKIQGDIDLAKATANEQAVKLLGEQKESVPMSGEIIYKDELGATCRRWNWKEADRVKLTQDTKNAIFMIEALPPADPQMLEDAVFELAAMIHLFCDGTVSTAILDEQKNEAILKKNGKYLLLQPHKKLSGRAWDMYKLAERSDLEQHSQTHLPREHEIRIEKIARLKELGIDPWPAMHPVTATCQQVIDEYKEGVEKHYSIAGRILAIRVHGKAAFATIQDRSGKIQVYLKSDHIGAEQFKILQELIDIGDIIWCDGTVFKTKTGEITLNVQKFDLLSKCLYPLPEKFHGISDIEIKYRQRYLDLISSEDTRDRFKKRSKIIGSIRSFLNSHEFVEVETPMLHPIAGGAAARPFVTHHNALDMNFYLRIAPELYLKRLVIGGFERVFEINRSFRNEGVSTRHNPEFTMVEFYMAHEDYNYAMNLVENLIRDMVEKVVGQSVIDFGQYKLDFSKPFQRLTLKESIMQYADIPLTQLEGKELDKILTKHNVVLENPNASEGQRLFALFEELVEKRLIQPTFILDYPIEISPLAKRDPRNKAYAARFELFIAGMEISNGFNELNDPFDQAQRFHDQVKAYEAGDQEAHQYDADYVKALEYGLPPTVGVGIGIDRLVMLLTNTTSIKDVILFPALKKQAE